MEHGTHIFYGVDCNKAEYEYLGKIFPGGSFVREVDIKAALLRYRSQPSVSKLEPETLSIEATLAQRGSRYGDFTDHARLCQTLKYALVNFNITTKDGTQITGRQPWFDLDPVKMQALEVICDKLARILSGDPNYDDNWIDIQGYARLVQDRLPKKE